MSGYPSLLAPLMNTSGLILTTALNTEAQTALASGVAANAKADTLLATALQTSGQNYTGLPAAGITLRDSASRSSITLTPSTSEIAVNGTVRSAGIGGNAFETSSSSFTVDASGNCKVNELTYTSLNPPITPGATPTLAEVLTAGNDGGDKAITGLTSLTSTLIVGSSPDGIAFQNVDASFRANFDGSVSATSFNLPNSTSIVAGSSGVISIDGASLSDVLNLTTTGNIVNTNAGGTLGVSTNNLKVYSDATSTQTGLIDASGSSYLQNYYLWGVSAGNFAITNDKNILTTGDITCNQLNYTTLNPPISSSWVGTATSDLDMANYKITSANQINGVVPQFKPTYDYYVAKGGNDTTGLGTILSPYLTIQKAITVCETFTDGVPRVINVSAGSYSENLTISKPRISIRGEGTSSHPDVGTAISGTITVGLTSGNSDLNNNNIYLKGFLINGLIEDSTASVVHRVIIDNCQLYANDRVLYLYPGGDYRAFVSQCNISNDNITATNPLIECGGSGMVSFNNNQMTAKGVSQNVFKLSSTCRIDLFAQNLLTSDSTGTNVAIAIFQHSSTQTIAIGQNAFLYSSAGAKRNTDTASAIYMTSSGSLVALFNTVGLTGLPAGQMAFYNTGSGVIIFGSNISTSSPAGSSATGISGVLNTTKFAGTSIQ